MIVSYKDSIFKKEQFLNFVGSQNIAIYLAEEELSYEERSDLLLCYMSIHKKTHIPTLNDIVAAILLENRGVELEEDFSYMSREERDQFFSDNKDLFGRWYLFLDSTLVNMPFCINGYMEVQGEDVIEHFGKEEDLTFVGLNISGIFGLEHFLEAYVSVIPQGSEVKVFTEHLFEPLFGGFSLSDLYTCGENTLFPLLASMYQQWFTEEDIKKVRDDGSHNKTD